MSQDVTGGGAAPEPYETHAPTAWQWTEEAFNRVSDGRLTVTVRSYQGIEIAEARGACPRCDDDVEFTLERDAPQAETGTLSARPVAPEAGQVDPYTPVDVECRCQSDHPGRPPGGRGCGIVFRVDVLREPGRPS